MTLAVMMRASLGHTGQQLRAGASGTFLFAALLVAAFTRILAAMSETHTDVTLHIAAFAWMIAFA